MENTHWEGLISSALIKITHDHRFYSKKEPLFACGFSFLQHVFVDAHTIYLRTRAVRAVSARALTTTNRSTLSVVGGSFGSPSPSLAGDHG